MLLQGYKENDLMWLTTCYGPAGDGVEAFRGDFVILHGELKKVSGQRNLPVAQIKQAVLLADDSYFKFVAGNLASADELPEFIQKYQPVLSADAQVYFFIDNIQGDCTIDVGGVTFNLFKFGGGITWNELTDMAALDKDDFRGQKAEEKVVTLADELKTWKSKAPATTLDDVLATMTDTKREAWGAI